MARAAASQTDQFVQQGVVIRYFFAEIVKFCIGDLVRGHFGHYLKNGVVVSGFTG
jgi:hypothetical protein